MQGPTSNPPTKQDSSPGSTYFTRRYMLPIGIIVGVILLMYLTLALLRPLLSGQSGSVVPTSAIQRDPVKDARAALFIGRDFVCSYGTGDLTQTLYVKGQKAAMHGPYETILFMDDKVYVWNEKNDVPIAFIVNVPSGVASNPMAWQFMARLQALRRDETKCKDQEVDDSVFDIPTDLSFKPIEEIQQALREKTAEKMRQVAKPTTAQPPPVR